MLNDDFNNRIYCCLLKWAVRSAVWIGSCIGIGGAILTMAFFAFLELEKRKPTLK